MSVASYRELTGRSFTHRFGDAPTAQRRFGVTLTTPAESNQAILNAIGIFHGAFHPEYPFLRCTEGSVKENTPTPYHAEVVYRYEVPQVGNVDFEPNPLARPDVWSFSTTTRQVPALTYYDGDGNGDEKALTNTAGDYFEGLQIESSEMRAVISGNRPTFPVGLANSVTNTINNAAFLNAQQYTWKCQGIGAQQRVEVVNDIEVRYWEVSVELLYRPESWVLKLPNVGFNYLPGGTSPKSPVAVTDDNSLSETYGQEVPSQTPQPLEPDGDIRSSGEPDILERRPYKSQDFASFFGAPPF